MKINLRYKLLNKSTVIACITFTCIIISFFSHAQIDSTLTFFKTSIEPHYGFIIPHNQSMKYVVQKPVWGADITFFKRTGGNRLWHLLYRKPSIGAGLHYMNLGNPDYFGSAIAVYVITGFYLKEKTNTFAYNFGYGLCYMTRPFNADNNYFNIAIGSHLNIFLRASFGYNAEIRNIGVKPFLSFIHFSNGSFKKPNLGLNMVSAGMMIALPVKKQYCFPLIGVPNFLDEKYTVSVSAGTTVHQKEPPLSPLYPVYILSAEGAWVYSYKHSAGIGFYWTHDRAIIYQKDYPEHNPVRSGPYLHFNTFYGKFAFSAQSGVYIYDKYKHDAPVFTRLGFSYTFLPNLKTGFYLKSHFFVADYFELSVSYTILNIKK